MTSLWIYFGICLSLTFNVSCYKFHFKLENDTESGIEATNDYVTFTPHSDGGLQVILVKDETNSILGHIGKSYNIGFFNESFEVYDNYTLEVEAETILEVTYEKHANEKRKLSLKWSGPTEKVFIDCFDFGTKQWYGGPEKKQQVWPLQNSNLKSSAYVSSEIDNAAVVERYWLNSAGEYIYVHPEVPLFVDYHENKNNHICFKAEVTAPYSSQRHRSFLAYDLWFLDNPKEAHLHAVETYLGKPSSMPDERMVRYPIWSSWARYNRYITQDIILSFANEIIEMGFNNAQIEIDDFWETCYGSLTVDETKFPDFGQLVKDLKELGFRVTVWVHPFINEDCTPWYTEALQNSYLVKNEDGSSVITWWSSNDTNAGYLDFTNPEAANWWSQRLKLFQETYDIDSFKFDAGESSFSPQVPVQNGSIDLHPEHIVNTYVRTCAEFGSMVEVRAALRTQDLPIYVRMVDKDSKFGLDNGLSTLITTLLQMNLNGYPFVLPDMIGGNGLTLVDGDLPFKELFIRWVQANAFMPVMQYSYVPWDFDNETILIAKKFTELHEEYADIILTGMKASIVDGTPTNPPIWWLDPTDEEALAVWDEYLVGESILVAPVLIEGAVTRDVYLPKGSWKSEDGTTHQGPTWLLDYPAPLDTLPYFIFLDDVVQVDGSKANISGLSTVILIVTLLLKYFF